MIRLIRQCSACGVSKPASEFPAKRSRCHPCHNEHMRRHRARGDVIAAKHAKRLERVLKKARRKLALQNVHVDEIVCPTCNARPTSSDDDTWVEPWAHRCAHGEPCPGWGSPGRHTVCSRNHDSEQEQGAA